MPPSEGLPQDVRTLLAAWSRREIGALYTLCDAFVGADSPNTSGVSGRLQDASLRTFPCARGVLGVRDWRGVARRKGTDTTARQGDCEHDDQAASWLPEIPSGVLGGTLDARSGRAHGEPAAVGHASDTARRHLEGPCEPARTRIARRKGGRVPTFARSRSSWLRARRSTSSGHSARSTLFLRSRSWPRAR